MFVYKTVVLKKIQHIIHEVGNKCYLLLIEVIKQNLKYAYTASIHYTTEEVVTNQTHLS